MDACAHFANFPKIVIPKIRKFSLEQISSESPIQIFFYLKEKKKHLTKV